MKNNGSLIFKIIFIIYLIITTKYFVIYIKKNYEYILCQSCINEIINAECYKCKPSILFKYIKIISRDETLNELLYNKKSIARFGDGEFELIFGNNITFQKFNKTLKDKLLKVLNSHIPNLLIGIIPLNDINFVRFMERNKFKLAKILKSYNIYHNAMITRFYSYNIYSNKSFIKNYVMKFKTMWNNRNILIIEGEKTRLGIGNNLFNNAKSIKRIISPAENAFNTCEKILKFIRNLNLDKNVLFLISLGPTATILAYDIHKLGYQTIDFGHFDIQYEYFLRNTGKMIRIPNKYVNEVKGGSFNITPVTDINYYKQIIFKIE